MTNINKLLILTSILGINNLVYATEYEFDSRINAVAFGVIQELEDNSTLNLGNRLGLPQYRAEINLRPDFSLSTENLEVGFKPRFNVQYNQLTDGITGEQSNTDTDAFVNEWLLRYKLNSKLFISYGRENLQWGPSSLISASSPFNDNNGRDNPRLEIPGQDYAKAIWIPSNQLSISLIANIDEGRRKTSNNFNKTYAAKIDYTGDEFYAGLIPSYKEGEKERLGWYMNKSVTDALLLHAEGSLLGSKQNRSLLVGGSYTLEDGGTVSLEFLNQQGGCDFSDFHFCFSNTTTAGSNRKLIRDKYALIQYSKNQVGDMFNITLRGTHGLDDSSSKITAFLEYEINDNAQLFFVGDFYSGSPNSEFGSLLDNAGMIGVGYTF